MITDDEPRSIREINADIPEWLCAMISQADVEASGGCPIREMQLKSRTT